MDFCFNIAPHFEHGSLDDAGKQERLAVREYIRKHVDANCKFKRAMQTTKIDSGDAIALY